MGESASMMQPDKERIDSGIDGPVILDKENANRPHNAASPRPN